MLVVLVIEESLEHGHEPEAGEAASYEDEDVGKSDHDHQRDEQDVKVALDLEDGSGESEVGVAVDKSRDVGEEDDSVDEVVQLFEE